MKIKIITDTAADFSNEELQKLDITAIAMPVTFDDENDTVKDTSLFWEKLIAGQVAKTSQPSPELFRAEFEKAQKEGYAVVCILISSALSATYSSAANVRSSIDYEHIYVIDSLSASGGEKLVVKKACSLKADGLSAPEIAEKIEEFKHKVKLFACLDTLKYLARSGRISKTIASVGSLLSLKPIITFNEKGEVATFSKSVGNTRATVKLLEKLQKDKPNLSYEFIPIYAYDEKNCQNLIAKIREAGYQINDSLTMPIGSTIGTHIGPGGFGIVYVLK